MKNRSFHGMLLDKAFENLMKTYPYNLLSDGTCIILKEGLVLIKGAEGVYSSYRHPFTTANKCFLNALNYQCYLLTNCEIKIDFLSAAIQLYQ